MVEYENERTLSLIFKAVSDETRRALLTQICQQGPSRVTDLAKMYSCSLNAISKHIKVLENAGLIKRSTIGRTHWIEVELSNLASVQAWFKELQSIWALRLDKLDEVLTREKDHE